MLGTRKSGGEWISSDLLSWPVFPCLDNTHTAHCAPPCRYFQRSLKLQVQMLTAKKAHRALKACSCALWNQARVDPGWPHQRSKVIVRLDQEVRNTGIDAHQIQWMQIGLDGLKELSYQIHMISPTRGTWPSAHCMLSRRLSLDLENWTGPSRHPPRSSWLQLVLQAHSLNSGPCSPLVSTV